MTALATAPTASTLFPENYLQPVPRRGLPSSKFDYVAPLRAPSPMAISVAIPHSSQRTLHADYVWNASILMADRIVSGEVGVSGLKVLELGAGAGLPSWAAARMGAEKTVVTDFDDPELISTLEKNLTSAVPKHLQPRVHIRGFTWGDDIQPLLDLSPHGFDKILLSDTIWSRAAHASLIATLSQLLAHSSAAQIHFACGFHTGRQVVRDFLEAASEEGIVSESPDTWEEVNVDGSRKPWRWVCDGLESGEESQEERNRWTLEGVLVADR